MQLKRIVIVCRVFVSEYMIYRWRIFAQTYKDVDVTLIGHVGYSMDDFGKGNRQFSLGFREEERFRYIPVTFDKKNNVPGFVGWLRVHQPDFVYIIGIESSGASLQAAYAKRHYLHNMKLALFTMRGLDFKKPTIGNPRPIVNNLRWLYFRKSLDAVFCHYPHGRDVIREQMGFTGPIYMQTQVGVNNEWFHPDPEARIRVRSRFGIQDDEYVFGTACRIIYYQKGIGDILDALPLPKKAKFMFIGDGPDFQRAKDDVRRKGLEGQVIFTGITQLPDPTGRKAGVEYVQDYFNALDCFVLMSRTSKLYIDTYPLVLSQAMATSLPCIVSTSGALPYEVGEIGTVVPEKDPESLKAAMCARFQDRNNGVEQGKRLFARLQTSFEMHHLNRCFYESVNDILEGRVNEGHFDQTNFEF